MDKSRKKEILNEWKNRKPEMGIIAFHFVEADETFLGISKDLSVGFNSSMFQLKLKSHPNQRMQELWNHVDEEGVELKIISKLKYDDPKEDHTKELKELLEICLLEDQYAKKI